MRGRLGHFNSSLFNTFYPRFFFHFVNADLSNGVDFSFPSAKYFSSLKVRVLIDQVVFVVKSLL